MGINELKKIVRAPRLSEEVSAALEARIARGELAPGDQLPTEKVLAETFGVSRAVVREAVARLKADGRIETRQGAGAFVAQAPKSLNFRFWQGEGPALVELRDIFELRSMIETAVAELAARRRIPEDVSTMQKHLDAMDLALADGSDGSEADDDFHLAIASATHNTYAYRLVEFLGRHFSDSRRLAWAGPGRDGALPEEAQAEHRALFEAIAAGNPARARRCAQQHLRGAASRVGIDLAADLTDDAG
ncbi:MAG: FadR/GntR family transcriptional regulator [Proteobacteria bacterium]|jgi:GntR family transcriptional repressor for pyruvate dehydrogenase complex|nr:FadR/GntR family transcriptional regulator [Pseudomonadota bacterium]